MYSRTIVRHTVCAQLLMLSLILVKIVLLPYMIWSLLGTSADAARVGDLAVISLGTCAALLLGSIGYHHAASLSTARSPVWLSFALMLIVHAPLFVYMVYKWMFSAVLQSAVLSFLSGSLSIVSHPMILVGVFGKWAELSGTLILCASYLLGVWMYFDEHPGAKRAPIRLKR